MDSEKKITRNVLIISIIAIALSIGVGFSFAYFSANIIGNDTAKENKVTAGKMELTFTEADGTLNLKNGQPGDSVSKNFQVENTGDYDTTFNIKLTDLDVTFTGKDLKYTLVEKQDATYTSEKTTDSLKKEGFINIYTIENKTMYLAIDIPITTDAIYYYTLTITFEDLEDVNQNYDQGAKFSGRINLDDDDKAQIYVPPKPFSEVIVADNKTIFADEAGNLRYAGSSEEVNNYIWFNCDNYENITDAQSAQEAGCEKWRIIGFFNNITTVSADDTTTEQNLVKIIRDESIGSISWDSSNVNDWTNSSLQKTLNSEEVNGYLNQDYKSSNNSKGITNATKSMIEKVEWNLGGLDPEDITAKETYEKERGNTTYKNHPSIWQGYIGLMYPSDYGYATNGSKDGKTDRETCLKTTLYSYSYCYEKNWLLKSADEWTLTPASDNSLYVSYVFSAGYVGGDGADNDYGVRPSLYLKSNVYIRKGEGTDKNPYILGYERDAEGKLRD